MVAHPELLEPVLERKRLVAAFAHARESCQRRVETVAKRHAARWHGPAAVWVAVRWRIGDGPATRVVAALVCVLGSVAAGVSVAGTLGHSLRSAGTELQRAHPVALAVAALLFVAAPTFAGLAWTGAVRRSGSSLGHVEGCGRYGAGSLVNAMLPARLGDAVRLALFARTLPRARCLGIARAVAVLEPARIGALLTVLGLAFVPWAAAAGLLLVAFAARRAPAPTAFAVLAVGAKVAAVATGLAALGLHPYDATRVVPALELAALLPLTPGNVASASLATSAALGGLHALPTAIALHLLETIGGAGFGLAATLVLGHRIVARRQPLGHPRKTPSGLVSVSSRGPREARAAAATATAISAVRADPISLAARAEVALP